MFYIHRKTSGLNHFYSTHLLYLQVPCDVIMNLKTQTARGSGKTQHQLEAFEIEPVKAQILNHGHIFVTITFAPQTMQVGGVIILASATVIVSWS